MLGSRLLGTGSYQGGNKREGGIYLLIIYLEKMTLFEKSCCSIPVKNSPCFTSPKQCFQVLGSSPYLAETCCFAGRKVHHYPLEFDKITKSQMSIFLCMPS